MMHFRQYFLLPFLLLSAGNALAQAVKNEMETSIQPNQMPEKAMLLLGPVLTDALRVRYFRETDGDLVTYESKLQWKGDFYSIEFEQDGSLLDIEKLVKFRSLPKEIRQQVETQMETEFGRHRIRRTQVQFSAGYSGQPDAEIISKFINNAGGELTVRYEIEADGRIGSQIGGYELLFDPDGKLVKRRPIVRRPLDNILY
jgi:hypothetical protein